jgi:hypothetical protein
MRSVRALAAFSLVLAACGTETGNGLVTTKAGLVSGDNTTNGFTGTDQQGTTLAVTSAHAYLRHFEFQRPGGKQDCEGYSASNNARIKCDGGKIRVNGPFAANLITRTATPSIGELEIPVGNYKRVDIHFTQEKMVDGVVPAGDPLSGKTLIASGNIAYPMGALTPFDLALEFEDDARFENTAGVEVGEDGVQEIFLDLDVMSWFAALPLTRCLDDGDLMIENGRITIEDQGARCNGLENALKEAIKTSAKLRSK